MKNKKRFLNIFAYVLYILFAWFCIVLVGEITKYYPYPDMSAFPIIMAHMLIMASGCLAIGAITMVVKTPNAARRTLKFAASLLVFGLVFIFLSITGLSLFSIFVLSLIAVVLFLIGMRFLEEKFWNPVYEIKKKYLLYRIKHEKKSSRVTVYQEKYKNLACHRMLTLIDQKRQLVCSYQSIEMLALNIGQNMIKREDEIRLKSEMLHAVEAKNLYESLKK